MKTLINHLLVIIYLTFSIQGYTQSIDNWGYWLTDIDHNVVADSEYDLVVIDYSRTGTNAFTNDEVNHMKIKPNGERRKVISYFSIGEAEEYRYYWKDEWKIKNPPLLENENPNWPGNYKVRYWLQDWQDILFGNENAYLDQIIKAGFDGMYLDIIDAFEYFENKRPQAEQEMVDLIINLTLYARLKNPNFIVITQNGERLLAHQDLLDLIDGAAKEDLYYGLEGDNIAVSQTEIDYSMDYLLDAQKKGKFILLASYVNTPSGKEFVINQAESLGFTTYISDRALDKLYKDSGVDAMAYTHKINPNSSISQRTPGDFFLNTLYKGQLKSSVSALAYNEESIYSERDDQNNLVFSEDVMFTDQQYGATVEYGITDHLEVGLRIPLTYTSLDLQETVGGDAMITNSEVGLGNIALLANLSIPFREELNTFSLFSIAYGLPTDSKSDALKSSTFFNANYTIEKIWNKVGVALGVGASNFNLSDSIENTKLTYRAGLVGIFSDRLFGDISYTKRGNGKFIESSAEFLMSKNSSLELFFATDLEADIEVLNYGLTFTIFH